MTGLQVILHPLPPTVRVPATHPCPEPVHTWLNLGRNVGLQPEPVIVRCDQFVVSVVEPQVRVRTDTFDVVGAGCELGWFLEREPVVGVLCDPYCFGVGRRTCQQQNRPYQ